MSGQRPAPNPPNLPGFTYLSLLGSGGYSDVFLYEQARPRRQVAVKVLLESGLTDTGRRQFSAEADLMARVSTHPYIVTIYDAAVSADGRPFLVMEYYQRDTMAKRARAERLSVPDVLRIGVQVSSAVETAHRAGILHRDIKPANILTSEYGRPGLTDFGISANRAEVVDDDGGMSVPWSPPEAFRTGAVTDERADVYSLAATIWHLLVGRSPYEIVGGDNRSLSMIRRIEGSSVPSTGRDDVSESFERILRQCMSKLASARLPSALEFARALNGVQQEMSLGATPIDIPEDAPAVRTTTGDAGDETRFKARVVQAQAPLDLAEGRSSSPGEGLPGMSPAPSLIVGVPKPQSAPIRAADSHARLDRQAAEDDPVPDMTVIGARHRLADVADAPSSRGPEGTRARTWVVVVGALLLLGVVGGLLVTMLHGQDPAAASNSPTSPSLSPLVNVGSVAAARVTVTRKGPTTVTVNFTVDDPHTGDLYVVTRTDQGPGDHQPQTVTTSSITLTGLASTPKVCVDVVRSSAGVSQPQPTHACEK